MFECLDDHHNIFSDDLEGYHVLKNQVQMKQKYCRQQEYFEIRIIFWEEVSIDDSPGPPIVELASTHQDTDSQISQVIVISEVVSSFCHNLHNFLEDDDQQEYD